MSMLEPEELRYASISMFALIIMTSMTVFMGFSASPYQPSQPAPPTSPNSQGTNVSITNATYWDSFGESAGFGGADATDETTGFGTLIDSVTDAIAYPVAVMNGWSVMIANAGWATAFVIVPSVIMLLVIVNAIVKIINSMPYT